MPRALVIIPAHNEAASISAVIAELKRDFAAADILVINDYSTDATHEIVASCHIPQIDNIFNLGYSWSIQTGLKYAVAHGYDYAIQFDADGQHIAAEANKLYKAALKTNADIVIGSRYLEDSGYKCPFFRRLGQKIFSLLIRIFCRKRITDPLSGFQCLNRRVIEKYAQFNDYPEFPDANLIIEMLYRGYQITEVPVAMRSRESGESMHGGIVAPIKYMVNMFYSIFFVFLQHFGFKRRFKEKFHR